ncbi:hypothetical protein AXG93_3415s1230 [Marchantia polymorpha subsp. ruderalis]|uniref:SnoaL-like domain-containing protein n=1 Tax=Marchantia polymorpha subsp. ruderalis TaxID=1480154 RepID=A0A176WG10_MARPO|nr:hypothetical protein AXG93_3415s1230 [Marchantia polymorpha subsp. ruderalis]
MAKVLSTSAFVSILGRSKEPLSPARNTCYPGLGTAGIAKLEAGRWSKCGVSCSRTVRTRVASKDDSSPSSASTQLVELPRQAVDIVQDFYELVNQRDYVSVSSLFAEDCFYEDFTFPEPIKGREEILKFFEKVMTSMGPELKFAIDDITRNDPDAVGVIWHLEDAASIAVKSTAAANDKLSLQGISSSQQPSLVTSRWYDLIFQTDLFIKSAG